MIAAHSYLRTLGADGDRLAAAARRDPMAEVPSCPGWTVHHLLGHAGGIHRHVARIVTERAQEAISFSEMPKGPEDPGERLAWFEEGLPLILDAFGGIDPVEPVWNWAEGVVPVRWWMRRMALETAMHRWDTEASVGDTTPIDTELAVDGVDETVDLWFEVGRHLAKQVGELSMHLHCTDTDGEWLIRFDAEGATTTREHAKGDVAVRGTASDLYLLLWNRVGPERCEVFGDASALRRFAEVVRI